MPNYEYACDKCSHRFEQLQRFSDPPVDTCPECGSSVRRLLHPVGIVFKGSGWYVTDSRSSDTATSAPTEKGQEDEQGSETESSDGKTDGTEKTKDPGNKKDDGKSAAKGQSKPVKASGEE